MNIIQIVGFCDSVKVGSFSSSNYWSWWIWELNIDLWESKGILLTPIQQHVYFPMRTLSKLRWEIKYEAYEAFADSSRLRLSFLLLASHRKLLIELLPMRVFSSRRIVANDYPQDCIISNISKSWKSNYVTLMTGIYYQCWIQASPRKRKDNYSLLISNEALRESGPSGCRGSRKELALWFPFLHWRLSPCPQAPSSCRLSLKISMRVSLLRTNNCWPGLEKWSKPGSSCDHEDCHSFWVRIRSVGLHQWLLVKL